MSASLRAVKVVPTGREAGRTAQQAADELQAGGEAVLRLLGQCPADERRDPSRGSELRSGSALCVLQQ